MKKAESSLTEYDVAEKKKCIVCGDEFVPTKNSTDDRVCSEKCLDELQYCETCGRAQPVYYYPTGGGAIRCEVCGSELID